MIQLHTTPFDRYRTPPKQNLFFMPLIWLFCWLYTWRFGLKIHRERMKGLKPPFLVLGTHHAFMDFYVTPLALFPHRANYVSELEGFENFGEWLYRQAGCLGTRKYTYDIALIRNIQKIMKRKGILVLYPEARYANVGTTSALPLSVAKLAKNLDVPLVTLQMHGNYLQSPIWNLKGRKGVRLSATVCQLFTKEELRKAPLAEVQEKLAEALRYDEYRWQLNQRMRIDAPWRAEGLQQVLYQCPRCKAEFQMQTKGAELFCTACAARWQMGEWGELLPNGAYAQSQGVNFTHIPDWYEWIRTQVESSVQKGSYKLDTRVRIEALPNAVNFIELGEGKLVHNQEGFFLTFTEYGETEEKILSFPSASLFSVHTEYDYRGKGQCITLSTLDNTYFIFPLEEGFNATKIQFATEALHRLHGGMKPQKRGGEAP